MQKLLQPIFFLFLSTIITAQVTSVSYMLDFDYQVGDTLYYDCNLRINSGSATTISQRIQFNTQYTIVAPTNSFVKVVENYMPLLNNATYSGVEPIDWQNGSVVVNDPAYPGYDFISITPYIDLQTYHYSDLYAGDVIKVFRISVVSENICPLEIRIYKNGVDPTSGDLAGGTDFSNGFFLGSFDQLYSGNFYSDDYANDIEITLDNVVTCIGELATLSPNLTCAPFDLSYAWSTGDTTPSISVSNEGSEEYSVTITGPNNYTQTLSAEVNNAQSVEESYSLCVGQQEDLKLDNGTWQSSDPAVVTVDFDGIATGVTPGTTILSYMDDDTGCQVDVSVSVMNSFTATVTGEDEICVGGTTTLSSDGDIGTWVSSNPNVASITNSGLATGVSPGITTFTFTSNTTLCQSLPSEPVIVHPPAIITLNDTQICPGESTMALSTDEGGGTWVTDNPTIATIDPFTGVITALTPGCATFTFTNNLGCFTQSEMLCINPDIQVSIIGSDQICIGGTTQLSPSSGGLWVSANAAVATVDNSGLVTGTGFGTTNFSFQDTVNYCAEGTTETITVGNIQGIANLGSDEICLNGTTQLSPNAGGNWVSSNTNVAFSNNTGEVTGIGIGTAQFIFTTDLEDCEVVDENIDIAVNELPVIALTGPSTICVQGFTTISTNGNLMHVEPGVSTYTDSGVITGLTPGVTEYYAINAEGCSSDTIEVTVIGSADIVFTGPNELCIGETTQVVPSIGGTWTSSDNTVVTITDGGLVTAVGAGIAILDFTDTANGCVSSNGLEVTIHNAPTVALETNIICVGSETLASPSTGGTWSSSNDNIASVSNIGNVVAYGAGTVQLVFTSNNTSCTSEPIELTVIPTPTLITQQTEICFGDSLFVQLGGTSSLNILGPNGFTSSPSTTTGSTIIDFPTPGTYILTPIDESSSGCLPEQTIITVFETPIIQSPLFTTIFVGDTLYITSNGFVAGLFPDNESIVTPINSTSLLAISAGTTQLAAYSEEGCQSNTIEITVLSSDPCQGLDTTDQSYILGTAYIDNNTNGTYDTGDAPLRNVVISTEPGDFSILTDDLGNYILPVIDGTYTLTAKVNEGSWIQDLITIDNVQISDPCNDGYNFGFIPTPAPTESVSLSMVNTIARCDWETNFTITVENTGAEPFDGVLAFTYDDETTLFTTDLVDFQVDGNTISSELGSLSPFSPQTYRVTVKMPGGSSNLPMLAFEAKLYNQSGELIEEYGYSDQLRCSYDPNDKREYPDREGDENLTLMDEDIEYTIRFQNNGNDTAFLVTIVDPLDASIDPSTIRVMNSSHPVETCIEGTDLIFLFEDILLVDSVTNYDASQGFVTFRCNVKEGVQEFTPVHNQADIIFDTNEPIVTNQTINTLVSVLCIDKETNIDVSICQGENYEGYTTAGTYTNSFELPFGCDSIVTIELEVQGITFAESAVDICQGENIFFNGMSYNIEETTVLVDSTYTTDGCLSDVISLLVNVSPDISIQLDTVICEGFDFEGYTTTGTYSIDSFDITTGCQLEYTINLEVLPASDPACTVGTYNTDAHLVNIYPNPATESIFIETEDLWESIRIVDTQGKLLSFVSQVEIGKLEVNVSQYLSGVYMIVFQHGDKYLTKRFVVK